MAHARKRGSALILGHFNAVSFLHVIPIFVHQSFPTLKKPNVDHRIPGAKLRAQCYKRQVYPPPFVLKISTLLWLGAQFVWLAQWTSEVAEGLPSWIVLGGCSLLPNNGQPHSRELGSCDHQCECTPY